MRISLVVVTSFLQTACKVLKTHTIKLTSSAEIQAQNILLKSTKGYVYLSKSNMSAKEIELIQGIQPFQCLEIKTPEQFNMQNREVTFTDFKLRKLIESSPECRKIKVGTRISVH
ncbi:hypothetical protein MKI79_03075 [Acinetobacter sp. A3.8]|uniref:Uncharacterized protein n=1 Tax=Acinetobacter sedimenti TaxID=2919922 RepID=A0A9X2B9S2_9GAMM|nr:hypothetical protein [Acinetobacter sedimenti]MCJ8145900.1 hypothetical protein [Acinetobacter sedimenti]